MLSHLPKATQLESGQGKLGLASKPIQSPPLEYESVPQGMGSLTRRWDNYTSNGFKGKT